MEGMCWLFWDMRYWTGEIVDSGNKMITCKFVGINRELTSMQTDKIGRRELWRQLAVVGTRTYM